jgi:hypothetical protein
VGTPGYFWTGINADNMSNTLYCNCEKCNRFFEKDISMKDWDSGKIHKQMKIDMKH